MTKKINTPKVSILCIAYNQQDYIRQTLDSFLMQKTSFSFEILIHDDCSTDGTTDTIRDYARRYPGIVKPIYEKENQYSKKNFEFIKNMYVAAKGTFIATCEGDDFWIEETKLQQQVDYLESNPDVAVCFHPVRVFFEDMSRDDTVYPVVSESDIFNTAHLIKENFIQTSSAMYRRRRNYNDMFANAMPGDWYTHLYHAQDGRIGYIDRVMASYRRHEGGVWWGAHAKNDTFWIQYGLSHIQTYNEVSRIFGDSYKDVINESMATIYDELFQLSLTEEASRRVVVDSVRLYPEMAVGAYESRKKRLKEDISVQEKLLDDIDSLHADIREKDSYIHELERQLKEIYDSTHWKVMRSLKKYSDKMKPNK